MARHYYAKWDTVVDGTYYGTSVDAFESKAERDEWVARPFGMLRGAAIDAREAERLVASTRSLFLHYDGPAPEFWYRRFGPKWGVGTYWDYDELAGGNLLMFALYRSH